MPSGRVSNHFVELELRHGFCVSLERRQGPAKQMGLEKHRPCNNKVIQLDARGIGWDFCSRKKRKQFSTVFSW